MRKYLFYCFFLMLSCVCFTQNILAQTVQAVTNSSGSSYADQDVVFEWSVGELALVETMANNSGILTNGLLQPLAPVFVITNGFVVAPTNIMSPNGDGINDVWVVKDLDRYPENELVIFDRAGRSVYSTKNYQNTWNGTISDVPLAEDTYFYILKLKKDGEETVVKGFITILKD